MQEYLSIMCVLEASHFQQSALWQAVYLAIKELVTMAEDVIMVISSVIKDIQSNSEVILAKHNLGTM